MRWNQIFGGLLIGLGLGLFAGMAIADWMQKWNPTPSAGGSLLLVLVGSAAIQQDRKKFAAVPSTAS